MDFNAEGTKISLIHFTGRFEVLDVESNECLFKYDTKQSSKCNFYLLNTAIALNFVCKTNKKTGIVEAAGIQLWEVRS